MKSIWALLFLIAPIVATQSVLMPQQSAQQTLAQAELIIQKAQDSQALAASSAAISAAQLSSSTAAQLAAASAIQAATSSSSSSLASTSWDTALGASWGLNLQPQQWSQVAYPWCQNDASNSKIWNTFASQAWSLIGQQSVNWDAWSVEHFTNPWIGDWICPSCSQQQQLQQQQQQQLQLPSWVDQKSQQLWQMWNDIVNTRWSSRFNNANSATGSSLYNQQNWLDNMQSQWNTDWTQNQWPSSSSSAWQGQGQWQPDNAAAWQSWQNNAQVQQPQQYDGSWQNNGAAWQSGSGYYNPSWQANGQQPQQWDSSWQNYGPNYNPTTWQSNGQQWSSWQNNANNNNYNYNGNGQSWWQQYGQNGQQQYWDGSNWQYSPSYPYDASQWQYGNGWQNGQAWSSSSNGNNGWQSGYNGWQNGYNGWQTGYNGWQNGQWSDQWQYGNTGTGTSGSGEALCMTTTVGQTNATLQCPAGTVINSITSAAYGETIGQCPTLTPTAYCTMDVSQTVLKTCRNQNMCSITVAQNILGAPVNNGQQCITQTPTGQYMQNGLTQTSSPFTLGVVYTCGVAGATLPTTGTGLGNFTFGNAASPTTSASTSVALLSIIGGLVAMTL